MKASKQNRNQEGASPNNHLIQKPLVQKKEKESSGVNATAQNSILGRKVIFGTKGSQAKLKVGAPNDRFEKEADATADKVVNKTSGGSDAVQKQATEEEQVQQKPIASGISSVQKKDLGEESNVQRQEMGTESDEEALQTQASTAKPPKSANSIEPKLNATKGNGQKLGGKAKQEMESGFGADFSNVNIHTDSKAAEMSDQIGAQAFTHGNDVYFNQGKYDPDSTEGKALLAHELTHTIQQEGANEKEASSSNETAIEKDSDEATMSFMQRMLSGGKEMGKKIMPKLKGGLRISRCQSDKGSVEIGELERETLKEEKPVEKKKEELSEYDKWKKENAPKVKSVKSLKLLSLAENKKTAEEQLAYRKQKRIEDINKAIANIEDYMTKIGKRPEKEEERIKLLKSDLKTTDEQLKLNPNSEDSQDSKDVPADRRLKVYSSFETIKSINTEIEAATKKWHAHDAEFVGSEELMGVLNEIHMSPADIKALVGQESGDLMASDTVINAGDKAGIAQIGATETKSVGHEAEDRKVPKEAILIAAKVLRSKINAAGISHGDFSDQNDYKSMAFAAYNAGGNAIRQSLAVAESEKKSTTSWSELIAEGTESPLYKGLEKTYSKTKVAGKFTEVKNYVANIFKRLS